MTPTQALAELVALKDLQDEFMRRKQRRAVAFKRDMEEVAECEAMEADYKRRKPLAWTAARAALAQAEGTDATRDVLAERQRQIEKEGWTPEHDDAEHKPGELATAAYHYAANAAACLGVQPGSLHIWDNWPWHPSWWKPTTPRRDLVKAGALILAEIDRIDRAAPKEQP